MSHQRDIKILVINCGSSSIKFALYQMPQQQLVAAGQLERIGSSDAVLRYSWHQAGQSQSLQQIGVYDNHQQGLQEIFRQLCQQQLLAEDDPPSSIAHRVVHGGNRFQQAVLINAEVIAAIRETISLAPLHNPPNVAGIETAMALFPNVPQIAAFDTAFHQTMPDYAWHYAIDREIATQHHIRRYGFHGLSHNYVSSAIATYLHKPLQQLRLISLHLGNGASVCAIDGGKSVDTSMGFTPTEGLVMGSRCGDIDAGVIFYLQRSLHFDASQVESMLQRSSGLKGLCGENDMRTIEKLAVEGNSDARLAIELFCYRVKKYIGAYMAVLGKVDAILFTGGIGEHSVTVRQKICDGLQELGISLDAQQNQRSTASITALHSKESAIEIYKVATNEELQIARQALVTL